MTVRISLFEYIYYQYISWNSALFYLCEESEMSTEQQAQSAWEDSMWVDWEMLHLCTHAERWHWHLLHLLPLPLQHRLYSDGERGVRHVLGETGEESVQLHCQWKTGEKYLLNSAWKGLINLIISYFSTLDESDLLQTFPEKRHLLVLSSYTSIFVSHK